MGIALYNLDLPYSAEAYLVKFASVLVKDFYTKGLLYQRHCTTPTADSPVQIV